MISIVKYLFEIEEEDKNPRGVFRSRTGRGKGRGMKGGRRLGKNTKVCPIGGPGQGDGQGQGQGKNR